jgi:hypothetical protein
MNDAYMSNLPDYLAAKLDAKAALHGCSWQSVYRLAMWLGLIAIEDRGGLRGAINALEDEAIPSGPHGAGRRVNIPHDARELVKMAEREDIGWQLAQAVALTAGLETIDARGGVNETKRWIETQRRLVMSQANAFAGIRA